MLNLYEPENVANSGVGYWGLNLKQYAKIEVFMDDGGGDSSVDDCWLKN